MNLTALFLSPTYLSGLADLLNSLTSNPSDLFLQDVKEFLGEHGQKNLKGQKSALELKELVFRQGSSASSDTYASCYTHLQSSPSNYDMTPDSIKHNVYVNPLDPSDTSPPLSPPPAYDHVIKALASASPPPNANINSSTNLPSKGANEKVQSIDETKLDMCKRQSSDPKHPPSSPKRTHSQESQGIPGASALRQMFKNRKQLPFKVGKPGVRLNDSGESGSQSSSESINSQGSMKVAGHFRKGPFGGRLGHSSPSTGKKLANYHLISNSQSGESGERPSYPIKSGLTQQVKLYKVWHYRDNKATKITKFNPSNNGISTMPGVEA